MILLGIFTPDGADFIFYAAAIAIEFIVMFALFWTYFDDVPLAGIRRGSLSAELWMLAHLPLQIGIVALAIGMSKFLQVEPGEVHSEAIPVLVVASIGIFGGLALIGILGARTLRQPLLFLPQATAVLALAAGGVVWSVQSLSPGVLVVVLAVLALAHGIVASILRTRTTVPHHESSTISAN